MGKDKRDATKKKGSRSSRASRSSSKNEEALARLMVTEMTAQEKEQHDAILEIKRREVKCRERELANEEYRQRQEYISELSERREKADMTVRWMMSFTSPLHPTLHNGN
ncbi:hypothetical protein Tco_1095721 [Tanacetum coccineum]